MYLMQSKINKKKNSEFLVTIKKNTSKNLNIYNYWT